MMVTKTTIVETPKYPVVDMHNHLGGGKQRLTPEVVNKYLTEMTAAGVKTVVNLDGGWGDRLKETIAALDEAHPGRFLLAARQFRRHRRFGLERTRGEAARGELQRRRQGTPSSTRLSASATATRTAS